MFKIIVAAVLVLGGLLSVQAITKTRVVARAATAYTQTREQAQLEYQLGERYGELPGEVARFSAQQIAREYTLGERYGETPSTARREYFLGERYGQTPAMIDREAFLGERYGVTP
jgi:type II secretory pathway pseudopilin PulG